MGGHYLRHSDLKIANYTWLQADGVHLSELGNELFLNQVAAGVEAFVAGKKVVHL